MKKRYLLTAIAIVMALLISPVEGQTQSAGKKSVTPAAANTPVTGSGTTGRLSKWTGVDGSNSFTLGNSNLLEDKFGKVGIGTTTPTSLLTVQGMIETTLGGYKFPDGSVQTTAGIAANDVVRSLNGLKGNLQLAAGPNITLLPAGNTITVAAPNVLTSVAHDNTLTGMGTSASPLSVAGPIVGTQTTTLLFPFVTAQAGFDTGIAITNTSMDTVGTTPQSGTCTISYFGTGTGGGPAPPAQTTNAPVPGGGQLTFVLSSGGGLGITGTPSFQGYLMVTCNFQYAHGFAFITDGPIGMARVSSSYLGLIVPAGPRNPNGETLDN